MVHSTANMQVLVLLPIPGLFAPPSSPLERALPLPAPAEQLFEGLLHDLFRWELPPAPCAYTLHHTPPSHLCVRIHSLFQVLVKIVMVQHLPEHLRIFAVLLLTKAVHMGSAYRQYRQCRQTGRDMEDGRKGQQQSTGSVTNWAMWQKCWGGVGWWCWGLLVQ